MKKTTNDPRISVNKLAEYIDAKAPRQRLILKDQKYPTDYKGMFYKEAAESIASCLASNGDNTAILDSVIAKLEQYKPESIGTQRRISANIDAIENFKLMLDDVFPLAGDAVLGELSAPKLQYWNVAVSVRPDIILKASGKGCAQLFGAIKLHFPKTYSLHDEAAGIVSAVIQEWFVSTRPDDTVGGQLCYVIDVGSRRVFSGAKSTVARMKEVKANCRNIAALWPDIRIDD
jgi:hypothetical protein